MVMGVIGVIVIFVVVTILVITGNGIYIFNKFKAYISDISSKSFGDVFHQILGILPNKYEIYLAVQMAIVLFLFVTSLVKSAKHKKKPVLNKNSFLHRNLKNEAQTDLDVLYNALLSKKELGVEDISTMFKIDKDVALEWCRTLENADLAMIDYPSFRRPILKLPGYGSDEKDEKSNKGPKRKEIKKMQKKLSKHKTHAMKKNPVESRKHENHHKVGHKRVVYHVKVKGVKPKVAKKSESMRKPKMAKKKVRVGGKSRDKKSKR